MITWLADFVQSKAARRLGRFCVQRVVTIFSASARKWKRRVNCFLSNAGLRRDLSAQRGVERFDPLAIAIDRKLGGLFSPASRKFGAQIPIINDRRNRLGDLLCVVGVNEEGCIAGDFRERRLGRRHDRGTEHHRLENRKTKTLIQGRKTTARAPRITVTSV